MSNHAIAERRVTTTVAVTGHGFVRAPRRRAARAIRRAGDLVMDGLMLLAMVAAVPIVILAVGVPIALVVQLLLWIIRLL